MDDPKLMTHNSPFKMLFLTFQRAGHVLKGLLKNLYYFVPWVPWKGQSAASNAELETHRDGFRRWSFWLLGGLEVALEEVN